MAMEIHDDAVPGEVAGNIMMAPDAERLIEGLEAISLLEYGTDKWVDQHHTLERLNAQAHVNARNRSDPFVLEALITFDKLPTVVEMLVTAEAWIDRVFPRLEGRLPDDRSMRAYYMLYHEALLINLLECLLYHESAAEALGEAVVDLVDLVARQLGGLIARSGRLQRRERRRRQKERARRRAEEAGGAAAAGSAAGGARAAKVVAAAEDDDDDDDDDDEEEGVRSAAEVVADEARPRAAARSLRRRGRALRLRSGVACVGILRYLAEHASSLPLAGVVRMVETHDLVLALVPLLENPPWVRRKSSPPPTGPAEAAKAAATPVVSWEKLIDNRWTAVAGPDLLKLSQPEAQAWLALHMLLSHEEVRKRWPMHSYRKSTLMRVRRYLNPVLLDQLPPLAGLQRFLDESSVMDAPSSTAEGLGRRVLLEASPELTEAVLAGATGQPAVRHRAAAIIRERATQSPTAGSGPSGSGETEGGVDAVAVATDEEKDSALWAAVAEASAKACLAVSDRDSAALKRLAGLYEEDSYAGLADGLTPGAAGADAPLSSDDEVAVLAAAEAALRGSASQPEQPTAAPAPAPSPSPAPAKPSQRKRAMIEVVDEMD